MSEWSWHLTPSAADAGSELPPESLDWLGVDVWPPVAAVSSQEEKKEGETDER